MSGEGWIQITGQERVEIVGCRKVVVADSVEVVVASSVVDRLYGNKVFSSENNHFISVDAEGSAAEG